ncbi:hypothetical protein SCP_1203810 [Sparassis crispa]|uniref:Uncharacterized protein n=1 Tax=Sparassis crispa TaxID=139825 RepID=A0A401H148_9APHY|nr:hypothetical protein SCP_1203810 [Sparassis crispa]GBE88151.1 hypothetical protein SCP_1203810 [Sparassis crispa]
MHAGLRAAEHVSAERGELEARPENYGRKCLRERNEMEMATGLGQAESIEWMEKRGNKKENIVVEGQAHAVPASVAVTSRQRALV